MHVYLYVYEAATILGFCAGLNGRLIGTLFERFKDGYPSHFTSGKMNNIIIWEK